MSGLSAASGPTRQCITVVLGASVSGGGLVTADVISAAITTSGGRVRLRFCGVVSGNRPGNNADAQLIIRRGAAVLQARDCYVLTTQQFLDRCAEMVDTVPAGAYTYTIAAYGVGTSPGDSTAWTVYPGAVLNLEELA